MGIESSLTCTKVQHTQGSEPVCPLLEVLVLDFVHVFNVALRSLRFLPRILGRTVLPFIHMDGPTQRQLYYVNLHPVLRKLCQTDRSWLVFRSGQAAYNPTS